MKVGLTVFAYVHGINSALIFLFSKMRFVNELKELKNISTFLI